MFLSRSSLRKTVHVLRSSSTSAALSVKAPDSYTLASANVNSQYKAHALPGKHPLDSYTSWTPAQGPSDSHWDDEPWDEDTLRSAAANHCVSTWGPTSAIKNLPVITHGEGCYLYDNTGKKYLDWTSQAVCANIGHSIPSSISSAIQKQMDEVPFIYGGLGLVEVRMRISKLLAELTPGDINGFVFANGGGEANEAAIRIARRYTGRQKILTQYRSYHGGSTACLSATGDFRRWFDESASSGFVKMFNPHPFGINWGGSEEENTALLLCTFSS